MHAVWWSILSVVVAATTSALLTPFVIRAAQLLGLVDMPGPRKVHKNPIPRVGGVAIAIGTVIGAGVALAIPSVREQLGPHVRHDLFVCLITSALILLLGLADDIFNISAKYKLIGLIGASAALCAAGIRIQDFSFYGTTIYDFGWVSWPITIFWIIGITVAINFIDGLDGLAGGVCAITALTLAIVAGYHGHIEAMIAALALAGALAGFLVHNWHPAKVFMGDSGSMFLGFTLASLTVMSSRTHGTFSGLIVPTLPLALPIIDTALTIVRRFLQRRSLFAAEQGHVHHRLIAIGLCQEHAVLLFYAVSVIASVSGLLMIFGTLWLKVIGLVSIVAMVVAVLRIAESVKLQETLQAFRRNRKMFRDTKRLQHQFEDQQLQFRHAKDFESWWRQVCKAAEAFEFVQMKLPVTNRDGKTIVRKWCAGDGQFDDAEVLAASVPVKQRRIGSTLKLEVHLGQSHYLEAASERLTMFSRLMDEYSVARLVSTLQHNPSYRHTSAIEPVLARLADSSDALNTFPPRDPVFGVPPELPQGLAKVAADVRIAIVHDFLYTYAGAERVLEQLLELYPNADVFSLFDFVEPGKRDFLKNKSVKTSFIQKLPFAKKHHRMFLPLMPLAIEQLDVADYDIVLSSSYVAAKGVITRPGQLHVCYCHTPVRVAWDQQKQYLNTVGLTFGLKGMLSRMILHYIRTWDVRSANGVDVFLTNSDFVGRRIEKVYRRDATTVYPPVAVDKFGLFEQKQDFYLTASRLVPYKRIDLIVEAFTQTPHRRLIVVGDGPEMERIKAKAGPNISLVGYQNDDALKRYMQHARAFIFAAEEDFGIVPVEAQACGTPVIACGRGGVAESVIDGKTGVFFHEQSVEALNAAVDRFETMSLVPAEIYKNAQRFSSERFRNEISAKVQSAWETHRARQMGTARDGDTSVNDAARRSGDEVEAAGV